MEFIDIPLKPVSRSDIHKLEIALMLATLFRHDVLEKIRESTERVTWIDSLAVAAGALARSKAGMPVSQIADDLGRSETTIRRHLSEKSEAGKLVSETYNKFVKEGIKIELPSYLSYDTERVQKLEEELKEYKEKVEKLERKLYRIRDALQDIIKEI